MNIWNFLYCSWYVNELKKTLKIKKQKNMQGYHFFYFALLPPHIVVSSPRDFVGATKARRMKRGLLLEDFTWITQPGDKLKPPPLAYTLRWDMAQNTRECKATAARWNKLSLSRRMFPAKYISNFFHRPCLIHTHTPRAKERIYTGDLR